MLVFGGGFDQLCIRMLNSAITMCFESHLSQCLYKIVCGCFVMFPIICHWTSLIYCSNSSDFSSVNSVRTLNVDLIRSAVLYAFYSDVF